MNSKLVGFAALATGLIFASCTTESSVDDSTLDQMIASPWKKTAMTAAPGLTVEGTVHTDLFNAPIGIVSACDKQEITTYRADSTVIFTTDSTGCGNRNDTAKVIFTNETSFKLIKRRSESQSDTTSYTVVSVSATQLVLRWTATAAQAPDNISHEVTETFTAQ